MKTCQNITAIEKSMLCNLEMIQLAKSGLIQEFTNKNDIKKIALNEIQTYTKN